MTSNRTVRTHVFCVTLCQHACFLRHTLSALHSPIPANNARRKFFWEKKLYKSTSRARAERGTHRRKNGKRTRRLVEHANTKSQKEENAREHKGGKRKKASPGNLNVVQSKLTVKNAILCKSPCSTKKGKHNMIRPRPVHREVAPGAPK